MPFSCIQLFNVHSQLISSGIRTDFNPDSEYFLSTNWSYSTFILHTFMLHVNLIRVRRIFIHNTCAYTRAIHMNNATVFENVLGEHLVIMIKLTAMNLFTYLLGYWLKRTCVFMVSYQFDEFDQNWVIWPNNVSSKERTPLILPWNLQCPFVDKPHIIKLRAKYQVVKAIFQYTHSSKNVE